MDEYIEQMANSLSESDWYVFMQFGAEYLMKNPELLLKLLLRRIEDQKCKTDTQFETDASLLNALLLKLGWVISKKAGD